MNVNAKMYNDLHLDGGGMTVVSGRVAPGRITTADWLMNTRVCY